jgi:hypothetical protein
MESLGRLCNIIPAAAGQPFKMRGCSTALIVVSGATAVVTLDELTSFGGSTTALPVITNVYWTTAVNGTAAWNLVSFTSPVSTYTHGTTAGLTTATCSAFHVFTSQLSDPYDYIEVAASGGGTVIAIPTDLVSQRSPVNLEVLAS